VRNLPVLSLVTGLPTGSVIALDSRVFDTPLRVDIVHRVVVWQEKNARTTLYKAKTRSEVRGGGRKPWKQKGTGRARQGSIRSPLWKGGGVAHGAVFRDWSISLNKKVRQLGLRVAMAAKAREQRLVVVDTLEMGNSKTGKLSKALMAQGLGLPPVGRKRLVFIDADDLLPDNFLLAVRNLPLAKPLPVSGVNVRDLVKASSVIITTAGLAQLTERLTLGLAQLTPLAAVTSAKLA
jgi:large subunit ribosomal protein L4